MLTEQTSELVINLSYIVAAFFFILGLKKLGHPLTARRGNFYSALGMFIAIVVTLLSHKIVDFGRDSSTVSHRSV